MAQIEHIPFNDITVQHLHELVSAKVEEGRTIEFKQELKIGTDSDKKEFCTDVATFANAIGGVLIIGIREAGGAAAEVVGIDAPNRDALARQIEEILQAGISPRIPWIGVRVIDLGNGKAGVVIKVPQSPMAPHAVGRHGTYRFCTRGESGKLPMDIPQIRNSILLSEGLRERLRSFRAQRVGRILAGDGCTKLTPGPRLILHLVPLNALGNPDEYDLSRFQRGDHSLFPIDSSGPSGTHFNIDGVIDISGQRQPKGALGYVQLFQQGAIIEAVDAVTMFMNQAEYSNALSAVYTLRKLPIAVGRYLGVLTTLGTPTPCYCMISYVGMKGRTLWLSNHEAGDTPCDRDMLFLPEIAINDATKPPGEILKPAFDALWRSFGYPMCDFYNEAGALNLPPPR